VISLSLSRPRNSLEETGTERRIFSIKGMIGSFLKSRDQGYEDEEEPVSHLV
jgi:hypothetical protein